MIKLETTEQRRKIMRAIKSKDTSVEILLRKALWKRGYRYRKNDTTITGTPDIAFKKYRIAIFIDSEFFHGYNWEIKKPKLKNNREYWITKIERNMTRDNKVNIALSEKGWTVLRFWGFEVKQDLRECVKIIEGQIDEMRKKIFYTEIEKNL